VLGRRRMGSTKTCAALNRTLPRPPSRQSALLQIQSRQRSRFLRPMSSLTPLKQIRRAHFIPTTPTGALRREGRIRLIAELISSNADPLRGLADGQRGPLEWVAISVCQLHRRSSAQACSRPPSPASRLLPSFPRRPYRLPCLIPASPPIPRNPQTCRRPRNPRHRSCPKNPPRPARSSIPTKGTELSRPQRLFCSSEDLMCDSPQDRETRVRCLVPGSLEQPVFEGGIHVAVVA